MKKVIMAISAVFLLSASAMAQNEENAERKQPSMEQMVQHRTSEMVKKYSLNEEQSAKLLELNKKYADMRLMGGRGNGHRQGMRSSENKGQRQVPDSIKKREVRGMQVKGDFQDVKKRMEEYDAQLQTILTEEQYAAYKADRGKMMQRGQRRGGNQHRNFNNK